MFTSVAKNTMFVLLVVLASAYLTTQTVNAACTDRPVDNSTVDASAVDKMSNFFVEVGCTIKSGAERVKERVESGYNYLKSKITPDDMKNGTLTGTNDDHITFQEDDAAGGIGGSVPAAPPVEFHETGAIDFRTALIAPEMCPQGQVHVNGKCRLDADL